MPVLAAFSVAALSIQLQTQPAPPRLPLPRPAAGTVKAVPNDNRAAAGALQGNTLRVAIDVVNAAWRPEGDADPEVPVMLFAEPGRAPTVPGPLIRVRQGAEVHLTIRSQVDSALVLRGLRPGRSGEDTVHVAARATRELRYRLDAPGTFAYWASFAGTGFDDRLWLDSQLNGAIVVDPPGARLADHVLLLSEWFHPFPDRPFEVVSVINGKAWPYTDRIQLAQGDSTRFRVINMFPLWHPMHLHGFFYRVTARGSWQADGPLAPALQPLLNTDLVPPGGTLTLDFAATTPGNWLFHCHFSFHMDETVTLSGSPSDSSGSAPSPPDGHGDAAADAHRMRGLVVGLQVSPAPGHVAYSASGAREIRLLVQKKPDRLIGGSTAYGFVVQRGDTVPARDSVVIPGPVLELVRNQPVRIKVLNHLDEPTGIHWHGLEIPSLPDGVPGWSGMGDHIFHNVAPADSFVAEFTPPRSGTYPYHSHLNERNQINSGMYGAIIVSDEPRDPRRDHLIVAGGGGPPLLPKSESPWALVNGRRFPAPLRLEAGVTHRLRLLSIHPDWRVAFTLRDDSTVARWRAIAKDGADMPSAQATDRPAHVEMGPGETADFEFKPLAPGTWRIEIRTVETGWYIPLTVIVTAARDRDS